MPGLERKRRIFAFVAVAGVTVAIVSRGWAKDVLTAGLAKTEAQGSAVLGSVDKLTQYGITWTFETPVKYGQFVGGDYWVLGPVTIKDVTPAWDGICNGSAVDPPVSEEQGYRQEWGKFSPKFAGYLRAKFPLKLEGTHSLVSTIGLEKPEIGGSGEGLDTAAVLTVLDRIPPKDAFRPPYVAGDKPIYTMSKLNWDRLPKLKKPEKPALPKFATLMQRPWLDHDTARVGNSSLHPKSNMTPSAGTNSREIADMSLLVMLDIPEREELTCRLVQLGIDLYPISLANEDAWRANGTAGLGRKWPILFAGIMTGSAKMQSPPALAESIDSDTKIVDKFSEDGATYYGKPTGEYPKGKPLFGNVTLKKYYQMQMKEGTGDHGARDPDGLVDASVGREPCSMTFVGPALAARLMGAQEIWNHPAFFDYVDRWVKEGGVQPPVEDRDPPEQTIYCYGDGFIKAMWQTYRPQADEIAAKHVKN